MGPNNTHAFAKELLPEPPSRWYLTGFLVPCDAPLEQKIDPTAEDEMDGADDSGANDDGVAPDRGAARRSILPSSLGVSVLVAAGVERIEAIVEWGDYIWESPDTEPAEDGTPAEAQPGEEPSALVAEEPPASALKIPKGYRRDPREERVTLDLPAPGAKPKEFVVPNSGGLTLHVTIRAVTAVTTRLPAGTRSMSVFLVNRRAAHEKHRYRTFAFQATLRLKCEKPFVPRPDLRGPAGGALTDEWDEKVADLQYRDVFEYACGHGVATETPCCDGHCREVWTTWIPAAEVERVAPAPLSGIELKMEALGALTDAADAAAKLSALVDQYRAWIASQRGGLSGLETTQDKTARDLLGLADFAADRITAGIAALADPQVLEAFRIANRTMARAARQRDAAAKGVTPDAVDAPAWRPFQLAFILLTLRSLVEPTHNDRERVDLLFFPTGGGKTEAYLGLAAFTMVLRRLRHPGLRGAGMSVLMRYTLRLLTLDQLGRAAALMCALELEREQNTVALGDWPFEIGLWVGSAATPNRMGRRGYDGPGKDETAYIKTQRFKRDSKRYPAPIPLENCPWCGTKFTADSFRLVPSDLNPLDLRVHCVNHHCDFASDRPLPILSVDEPIYRRLPAFLIATVDKFAALPWTGPSGKLFGLVDSADKNGFYGPCDKDAGVALGGPLPPPELIIQDELHLISGPLGTIAGVYETAIDWLASRQSGEHWLRPKIIASTATVRRADRQIRALFERQQVDIFPPPGPDRRDSFFAKTVRSSESPARLYVGVAAQGRSLKVVLLRAGLALLSRGETLYAAAGGKKNHDNPADPYMTLLGYFNSLRELGGSRRIVEDEVRTRLAQYARRRRRDPEDRLFSDRDISYEVLELTSRVPTNEVASAKRRLAERFDADDHVDVALATNMISVGLDIVRLGLMVVLGQPKTSAEYIQATSRVGRDPERPGLVVTLLNIHKPRDRSHYERFGTYHATFYRAVEATSVTPFSPRALDRALAAALVALCRQGRAELTPALGASEILRFRTQLTNFALRFAERAENHRNDWASAAERQLLRDHVLNRVNSLLDDWFTIAQEYAATNTRLQYQPHEASPAKRLLYEFLNPDVPNLNAKQRNFRANRSMRDVETSVELELKPLHEWGGPK